MISTKKTVVYLRNSAGFQENSIALQKERALLCANQNGLFIDDYYEDKDTSAVKNSIKERYWLYRLIKDIEEERVGTIIVYKRDRLARKVEEHMILYALFEEKKVKVYFSAANEFPMVYSPQGFTIEYLLASFAENEEVQLKQRISDTRAAKFKTGETIPANLPFGYKREVGGSDGKKKFRIVLVPHEIKVVKTIFSTLLHGNFQTLDDFRIYLKVNRISTRGNQSTMGSKNIEDLISNRTYKGELVRRFSDNVITLPLASHLHVLSKQEWDKAQQILEQIKPNKEKLPKMVFLLEGFIVCSQCNKKMKVVVEKRQNKFIGFYQCNKHKYRYEKLEIELRVLGDVLREMSLHLISVKEYKFLKPLAKKIHVHIQTFNSEINHLMDEYAKLMEKYLTLDDIKIKRTLLEKCNNIRNKLDDRRERVNQLQIMENNFKLNAKPIKEVDNFLKDFNNYSDEYRAILLKNVIAEVKGSKQSIHIVYKYFDQILGGRDEIDAK